MYCIISDTNNPYFNLALEEYLLKNKTGEYFILSINDTSVVAGKHQCIHREVNTRFVTENKIPVLRRITGGGTVYHDAGNINFCFIRNCEEGKQIDFQRNLLPVTEYLSTFAIEAFIEGSDIKVDGLKISGNAEHVYKTRVLHHGTLLWNASLETLGNCIRKENYGYVTRAVASRPSRVTNLSERINSIRDIDDFLKSMFSYFLRVLPSAISYELPGEQVQEINILSERYATWEWNYAYGPEYEFSSEFNSGDKKVMLSLCVKDGIIVECSITGDPGLKLAEGNLKGCRHMPVDIGEKTKNLNVDPYFFF